MKKIFAILMTLTLLVSALALPALAEDSTPAVDQVASATAKGGRGNQPGRMPGNTQNGQQSFGKGGQMPQMPGAGQDSQQVPQLPGAGQDSQQVPQLPGASRNGQQSFGKGGRHGGQSGGKMTGIFDQLLKDGVITQEIYDAIISYLNQQVQPAEVPAEGTDTPAEGTEPPALPEGEAPAEGEPAGPEARLLKQLLDSGVITQEQYDALLAEYTAAPAADTNT